MYFMLKKQKGIGLIETVVTMLIIAGAAIALLRFQLYLSYSNNVTQQQSTAIQLALSKIETLRDFSIMVGVGSYANIASGTSNTVANNTTYTLTWTITTSVTPSYKAINVAVTWTDSTGTANTITETTNVAGIDPSFSGVVM